jgi:primary-amine oxidase
MRDRVNRLTHEFVIQLDPLVLASQAPRPGLQPALTTTEFAEFEDAVRSSPAFQAAMAERGITNLEHVAIDSEPVGMFTPDRYEGRRIAWGAVYWREASTDNTYARLVDGVIPIVDLDEMQVLEVENHEVLPVPNDPAPLDRTRHAPARHGLRTLDIAQPDGPSFEVDGWQVSWQGWSFQIGFTSREGLVLRNLHFDAGHGPRSVVRRLALAEIFVPYGDTIPGKYRQNFFDFGEVGAGIATNSLRLGCDCLGAIRYFDAVVTGGDGELIELENAICMHEEDTGILWKHTDDRASTSDVRRRRRLTISSFVTLGNYDYGMFAHLYQDGSIEIEVKMNGIVSTAGERPGKPSRYGRLVAPNVVASNHQHYFNVRMEMAVDNSPNRLVEVQMEPESDPQRNPYGNAFHVSNRRVDVEGGLDIDTPTSRHWRIESTTVANAYGEPTAYRLVPGPAALPFATAESSPIVRAGFTQHPLWATPYDPTERFPAGDFVNQSRKPGGLPVWTKAARSLEAVDLVLWYTLGATHFPRPEDWPIISTVNLSFRLEPDGFFNENAALDLPAPANCHTE